MINVAAGPPIFETLAATGPDGKVVRLDALMDVLAIRNNPMLDGAARERLKPAIRDWMGEVERVVIDNADFMEMLEPAGGGPGLIESLDSGNSDQRKMMNQGPTQLGSAGNLSARLIELGLISEDQHALNQHISADYFQACIREVAPPGEQAQNDQERLARTNRYNRYLFSVAAGDAVATYHRLLTVAGGNYERVVAALKLPEAEAAKVKAGAPGPGADDATKRRAARKLLGGLALAQKQAALRAARDLGGPVDPFGAGVAKADTGVVA